MFNPVIGMTQGEAALGMAVHGPRTLVASSSVPQPPQLTSTELADNTVNID